MFDELYRIDTEGVEDEGWCGGCGEEERNYEKRTKAYRWSIVLRVLPTALARN
jgi:hypothetical protein